MLNFRGADLKYTVGVVEGLHSVCADRLPQIALSGRSNVGKSSLINTLLGRKSLARVSSAPGKTITVNFYAVPPQGKNAAAAYLVDLPGYGFAKRSPEEKERFRALTDGYFEGGLANLSLVLQLVDLAVGPTEDDLLMIDYLNRKGIPYAIAATKADKPNKTERTAAESALRARREIPRDVPIIPFSAKTGEGLTAVVSAINSAIK